MSDSEILEKVAEVVRDCIDDDGIEIGMDTVAADVDGWDSLMHITILAALEDEFGVGFPLTKVRRAETVGDLVAMISEQTRRG